MFSQIFSLAVFIVIALFLGFSVLRKNSKNEVNRSFFFLTFAVSVWITTCYFSSIIENASTVNYLARLLYASGFFVAAFYLLLCFSLTGMRDKIRKIFVWIVFLTLFVFVALVFSTNFVVSDFRLLGKGIEVIFGRGEIIFRILMTLFFAFATILLVLRYRISDPEKKNEIIYASGGFVFLAPAFLENMGIINFIKSSPNYLTYSGMICFSMVFFLMSCGYSITRPRIFNAKVLLLELSSFAVLLISFLQVFLAANIPVMAIDLFAFIILLFLLAKLIRSSENEIRQGKRLEYFDEEIQKLDQAKLEFMNVASHQLRTPITVIKGVVSLIRSGEIEMFEEAKKRQFYESAWFKCLKLEEVVNDILNANYLASRKFNVLEKELELVDLRDLLGGIIESYKKEINPEEMEIEIKHFDSSVPKIYAQEDYLKEAFKCLLNNAIKYTPFPRKNAEGKKSKGLVEANIWREGIYAVIEIKDNGIGIPEKEMHNMFRKFYRASNAKNIYNDGSGLGLYITKEIVEGHFGSISVKSEEGEGTSFIVKIPINPKMVQGNSDLTKT